MTSGKTQNFKKQSLLVFHVVPYKTILSVLTYKLCCLSHRVQTSTNVYKRLQTSTNVKSSKKSKHREQQQHINF